MKTQSPKTTDFTNKNKKRDKETYLFISRNKQLNAFDFIEIEFITQLQSLKIKKSPHKRNYIEIMR